jgi:hypothetical protein
MAKSATRQANPESMTRASCQVGAISFMTPRGGSWYLRHIERITRSACAAAFALRPTQQSCHLPWRHSQRQRRSYSLLRRLSHLQACCGFGSSKSVPSYWAVFISTRMPWIVFSEAFKTRPAGCGAMFTTKHPSPFHASIAFMTSRFGGSCVPSGAKSCTGG